MKSFQLHHGKGLGRVPSAGANRACSRRRGCSPITCSQQPGTQTAAGCSRRQALVATTAGGIAQLLAGTSPARADTEAAAEPAPAPPAAAPLAPAFNPAGLTHFEDPTLAYSFLYPSATASGAPLQLVLTRPPEKYSSAAPLSADARQRIVSELFDLRRFVTVSVTVGPASGVLKEKPLTAWKPREVALTVLIDRSTARLSSGQRTALNDVEAVHVEQRPDGPYWVYEHVAQGSPTLASSSKETYRHALAVTATRPGLDGQPYLYTLNLSCPQDLWDDLQPQFQAAVDSFALTQPTNSYIPPDKDPWLFF